MCILSCLSAYRIVVIILINLFTHLFQDIPLRGVFNLAITDLNGNQWKRVRNLLTPAFSSSKMKNVRFML